MTAGRRVVVGPPDYQDALVPVAAEVLLEWAHWIGMLTDALNAAAETTRFDLSRRLPAGVDLDRLVHRLTQTEDRIGALLDGDGWWSP